MDTQQAIDYIKCTKELNELSALLMTQATNEKKRLKRKLSTQTGLALYWIWRLTTEYLDEDMMAEAINKCEGEENGNKN